MTTVAKAMGLALSQQAQRVIGVTAVAWDVQLPSAHAVARRAPYGYVPVRALRRQNKRLPGLGCAQSAPQGGQESLARPGAFLAAVRLINPAPVLAHSW